MILSLIVASIFSALLLIASLITTNTRRIAIAGRFEDAVSEEDIFKAKVLKYIDVILHFGIKIQAISLAYLVYHSV